VPELVAHIRTIPRVLRANLYDVDGRIMWSSDDAMTGQRFHNPELNRALAGDLVNEVGLLTEDAKAEHVGLQVPASGYFVEAYLPMWRGAEIVCVVELYKTSAALEAAVARASRIIAGSAVLGGLVPVAGLYWIVRRDARQIERQRSDLHRVSSLAGIGQTIGALAHSLRHPLATIRHLTELLPGRLTERPESDELADNIDRLDRYAREVASMAQFSDAALQPVDPFFVVRAAVSRQRAALRRAGVEVAIDDQRQARRIVEVDPLMLVQAMASLVTEASRDSTRLRIVLSEPDREHTRIDFAAESDLPAESGGTSDADGFGLTLAQRMIERSKASLDVLHQGERAALFRITLRAGS
jgi:signal transduction histidine kinase